MTDECFSSAELFATCGGYFAGSCVNGTCVCSEGWSGHADFITMDLGQWGGPVLECPSQSVALTVLWILPLIPCLIALVSIIRMSRKHWTIYEDNQTKKKGIIALISSLLFCCIVTCLAKTFGDSAHNLIGIHKGMTILFSTTCVLAYVTIGIFHAQHFSLILKTDTLKRSQHEVKLILSSIGAYENWPQILLNLTFMSFPFFGKPSEGRYDTKRIQFYCYLSMNAACTIVMIVRSYRLKIYIKKLFKSLVIKSASNAFNRDTCNALLSIRDQLCQIQDEIILHCSMHGLVKFTFVAVPELRTKTSYILPFSILSFAFVVVRVLKMLRMVHYQNARPHRDIGERVVVHRTSNVRLEDGLPGLVATADYAPLNGEMT